MAKERQTQENFAPENGNRFRDKKEKHTLAVRLISTVVLLSLLAFYCASGIVFTELQPTTEAWVDALAYISMVCSLAIIAVCGFEINRALKFEKWYFITIILLIDALVFFAPTRAHEYNFAFYQDWNFDRYWFLYFFGTLLVLLIACVAIGMTDQKIGIRYALIAFVSNSILVFAFKGFTILMLSFGSSHGQFSYITVIWIWLMAIFADSFAYLGGMRFGKHKMAPVISPKKTWEGAIIGISSAVAAGILMALLLHYLEPTLQPFTTPIMNQERDWIEVVVLILFAIIFPIISLFGDLYFSWIKRITNVKDFSNLIPGHGGMTDRMDSFIFVNAIAFIIVGFIA